MVHKFQHKRSPCGWASGSRWASDSARVLGRHLEGRQRGCVLLTWTFQVSLSSSSVTAATHSIQMRIRCWFLDARLRRVAAFLCMAAPRLRTVRAADAVVPREGSVSVTCVVAGATHTAAVVAGATLSASLRNAICKSHIALIQLGLLVRPSLNGCACSEERRVGDKNRHVSLTLNFTATKRRPNECPGYDSALIVWTKPPC